MFSLVLSRWWSYNNSSYPYSESVKRSLFHVATISSLRENFRCVIFIVFYVSMFHEHSNICRYSNSQSNLYSILAWLSLLHSDRIAPTILLNCFFYLCCFSPHMTRDKTRELLTSPLVSVVKNIHDFCLVNWGGKFIRVLDGNSGRNFASR